MRRSRRRCGRACARSSGRASGSWSKDCRRRCCPGGPRGSTGASWTARGRPACWRWPAPGRPRARRAGRCACWPSAWSSWSTWTGSPTRRCDRLPKKRAQAAPEEDVVHPAETVGGVRLPHGGCARGLPPTSRPEIPGRVSGRDLHAADRREPRAAAGGPGAGGAVRLRVRAQRHRQPVPRLRAARRLAPRAVTEGRKRGDWARFVAALLEGRYAEAERLVLVMDQLNTHSPASLYEIFPPERAKRLADRLEIHHTPKHGSWLNMAEIEFSALARGLPERVGARPALERHVTAWERDRNGAGVAADWRFTTADARIKLRKLYPTIDA